MSMSGSSFESTERITGEKQAPKADNLDEFRLLLAKQDKKPIQDCSGGKCKDAKKLPKDDKHMPIFRIFGCSYLI